MALFPSHSGFWNMDCSFRSSCGGCGQRSPPHGGWYPFESLSSFSTVAGLLAPVHQELFPVASVLDLGCGDGDYAFLFANLGVHVDAVDNASCNFNGMRGVQRLAQACSVPLTIVDTDLDARFPFADGEYGLTLLLGLLYHLKNPYGVLEQLAYRTRWCVMSTRVAHPAANALGYCQ